MKKNAQIFVDAKFTKMTKNAHMIQSVQFLTEESNHSVEHKP